MADNAQISTGTGPLVAADEVTINSVVVLAQRIKVGFGTDGNYVDVSAGANALPVADAGIGLATDTTVFGGSGNMPLLAGIRKLISQFAAGFTMSGSVSMADNEGVKGQMGGVTSNPSVSITRTADANPYVANDLVANTVTAGSVSYPAISAARVALGSFQIDRLRLYSNHTTGLSGVSMRVHLWTTAPVYAVGDNGVFAITSGAANWLGSFTGVFTQFTDGAGAMLIPDAGSPCVDLAAGQTIAWSLVTLGGFTPQSAKTFTIIPEVKQD